MRSPTPRPAVDLLRGVPAFCTRHSASFRKVPTTGIGGLLHLLRPPASARPASGPERKDRAVIPPDRVGASLTPAPPTPPGMRVRTGRLASLPGERGTRRRKAA